MATLLLTAVGTAIGGPIGGAIGAILGQAVDQRVFAPKGRQGPRLGDLSVQTSAYGTAIPRVFGTVRAAGTVIWSTDLVEARTTQSNGKGQPKTTTFSYSVSFAVALSARPVLRVGRIWADGNLLRGAGGDFKTATKFRLLPGSADQQADPLIAGAEGLGTTPAYRDCAVAVFENFQLAEYGNRIPMLSFEIVADERPVGVATILAELSAGALAGASAEVVEGLAVQGDSVRGVAETLAAALPVSLVDDGLKLVLDGNTTGVLDGKDLGATVTTKAGPRMVETRRAAAAIPEVLSIAYYDVGRDYQAGVQRARREGGSRREDRIDLAASLPAGVAKQIAEARLTRLWRERRTVTVTLPWRAMDLRPGDRVTLDALPGLWRIASVAFERMVVRLELWPQFVASAIAPAADPGRPVAQPDLVHGATILALIDLPPLGNAADRSPQVVVAANGASTGWRNAPLLASVDGGVNYATMGGTAAPATMGVAETLLGPAGTALVDRVNYVDIALANAGLVLNDADDAALLSGANFAMLGREAFQFGQAVPLGGMRYRLSELWRGRRGTEAEVGTHLTNESFVLLAADSLAPVPPGLAVAGLVVLAAGIGDGPGIAATIATIGASITPLAPVGLAANVTPEGGIAITWIRRSREGWGWTDAVEVPLGEEGEQYRVTRTAAGRPDLIAETATPAWVYPAALAADDRAFGLCAVTVSVAQVGSRAVSAATALLVSLN